MLDEPSLAVQAKSSDTALGGSSGLAEAVSKQAQATEQESEAETGPSENFGTELSHHEKTGIPSAQTERSSGAVGPDLRSEDCEGSGGAALKVSLSSHVPAETSRLPETEAVNRATTNETLISPRDMPKSARRGSHSRSSSKDRKL